MGAFVNFPNVTGISYIPTKKYIKILFSKKEYFNLFGNSTTRLKILVFRNLFERHDILKCGKGEKIKCSHIFETVTTI